MPSSYERILDRINSSQNKGNKNLVIRALRWIIYYRGSLSTPELLEALVVEEGEVEIDHSKMTTEEDILFWASSLVRKKVDGTLEIAHFTVKEFLVAIDCKRTPQFSPYLMSPGEASIELARTCLTYLNCKPFSEIEPFSELKIEGVNQVYDVVERHRFLLHATSCWSLYYDQLQEDAVSWVLMCQLFHPSITKQFNLYRLLRAWNSVGLYENFFDEWFDSIDVSEFKDTTPLHWAASMGLCKLCAWLISQGLSVHQMSSMGTPLYCALLGSWAENGVGTAENVRIGIALSGYPRVEYRLEVVQLLLNTGVSPIAPTNPLTDALTLQVSFHLAVADSDTRICSALIAAGARFSKSDLSSRLSHHGLILEFIINQALEDMHSILPEGRQTLFEIMANYVRNPDKTKRSPAIVALCHQLHEPLLALIEEDVREVEMQALSEAATSTVLRSSKRVASSEVECESISARKRQANLER